MRTPGKLVAAVLTALALVAVTGCTGSGGSPGPARTELTPVQRLAAAKTTLDAAPSVHLALSSADLPKGVTGVVSGDGWGARPPAFQGSFKILMAGIPADAAITSVGGEVWAKLPLVPGVNKIDPNALGLPDPAQFLSTDHGVSNLLTTTTQAALGKPIRVGAEVLTRITGTLPGSAVVALLRIGDPAGTYQVGYALTEANQLRQVTLTGPFFGAGSSATYTLVLDRYGDPVTITKPA